MRHALPFWGRRRWLPAAGLIATLGAAMPAAPHGAAGPAGVISTVVGGAGGPARGTSVAVGDPCGVTYAGGHLYATDQVVRAVSTRTGWLSTPAGDTTQTIGPLGDGRPAVAASVESCGTPAVDHSGNLVIADTSHFRVRVVAARTGTFYGQRMTAHDIYTIAGNGGLGPSRERVPATRTRLGFPTGVALDGAGNVVLANSGAAAPVPFPALLQVVAARTGTFYGQRMTAGDIYIVAGKGGSPVSGDGGPAVKAGLGFNIGQVALDRFGDLVLADESGNSIRVVAERSGTLYGQKMTTGDIYSVAGDGTAGFSGDGGPATKAELSRPGGVTVDAAGNLLIADTRNGRVRVVAATSGTFYGQRMTAGHIYTIAGGGTGGNGGTAASARLPHPNGVAVDGAGNPVVAGSATRCGWSRRGPGPSTGNG